MIYITTTFVADRDISPSVIEWIKEVFVANALSSTIFTDAKLMRVLSNDQTDVDSIACQLQTTSLSEGNAWYETTGTRLLSQLLEGQGQKVMFFTTYLEGI